MSCVEIVSNLALKLLPTALQDLISRASELEMKVRRLDATIHAAPPIAMPPDGNPVERQLGMLKAAFEGDTV